MLAFNQSCVYWKTDGFEVPHRWKGISTSRTNPPWFLIWLLYTIVSCYIYIYDTYFNHIHIYVYIYICILYNYNSWWVSRHFSSCFPSTISEQIKIRSQQINVNKGPWIWTEVTNLKGDSISPSVNEHRPHLPSPFSVKSHYLMPGIFITS